MPYAGSTDLARIDLEVYDGSTTVALEVTAPNGTATTPAVTRVDDGVPADLGKTWTAIVPYPVGGVWWHRWMVSNTGAGVMPLKVLVQPSAPGGWTTYATSDVLATYLDDVPPEDAAILLRDATRLLDQILKCAVYDVDTNGMPTNAKVILALSDACCELVRWWLETGDPTGALDNLTGVSAGSVSISRRIRMSGGGVSSGGSSRVGEQVFVILDNAGLLNNGPWTFF